MCGVEDQKKINEIVKNLDKEKKHAMFTIYAFCRIVDDIADNDQKKKR